jgi:hypothetical protein
MLREHRRKSMLLRLLLLLLLQVPISRQEVAVISSG